MREITITKAKGGLLPPVINSVVGHFNLIDNPNRKCWQFWKPKKVLNLLSINKF